MALQPQTHSIPLSLGIDTKNNPVLVSEDKWVLIQNAKFTKGSVGQIQTRNGYTALTNAIAGGGSIFSGMALAQLGDELDLFANNNQFLSYSPSQSAWVPRATIQSITPSVTSIVKNNYSQSCPDAAMLSNVTVYAWVDTRGGVWCKVFDQENGTVLLADTQLDSLGNRPRVVVNGTKLTVFYIAGQGAHANHIVAQTIDPANPLAGPGNQVDTTIALTAPTDCFEVVTLAGNFGVAWFKSGVSAELGASTLAFTSLTLGTTVSLFTSDEVAALGASVISNGDFAIGAACQTNGDVLAYFLNPSSLATVNSYTHAMVTSASPTGCVVAVIGTDLAILVNHPPNSNAGTDRFIENYEFSEGSGYLSSTTVARSVGFVSTPFVGPLSAVYLLVAYQSTVQPTYFLMALGGSIAGRFMALNAAPIPADPSHFFSGFSHPMILASGEWGFALAQQTTLESAGGTAVVLDGISLLTLSSNETQTRSTQLGADLTIAGGLPRLYDGTAVFENGFNVFPEAVTVELLTSQLGIIDYIYTPSAASFKIVFPINPDGSGEDGKLIRDGEYFADGTHCFYFQVDEQSSGAPPNSGSGLTPEPIPISSTNTADQIAAIFYTIVQPLAVTWTVTIADNEVSFTNTGGLGSMWYLWDQFQLAAQANGTNSVAAVYVVNAIPGQFISPGQWFSFPMAVNSGNQLQYVWFQVSSDGGTTFQGADPAPYGSVANGFVVQVLSTDDESVVAGKMVSQISSGAFSVTPGAGSQVIFTDNVTAAVPTNPSSGDMGRAMGTFGAVAAGQFDSYEFSAIYEAVDYQGQLHRSAPSVATQITFPAYGVGNAVVQVTVDTLRLTARDSVDIAIYSTIADGTNFYRLTSPTVLLQNNPAVDYLTYTDRTTDVVLQGNELLYTTGGVVPNNCPPAFTQVVNFQDRLWVNDSEDPQLWWFSKDFQTGVAVEWSVEQTMRFDPIGGSTVAGYAMDSGLVIFGTEFPWLVNGLGPDATGNGTFQGPTVITSAVGARDPGSIVEIPTGVMFKSAKGIYLLDRGLSVNQAEINGNAVDAYAADVVVSAQVIPNTTEVRFLSLTGATLLYDYQFQQWSPFTGHQGVDSVVFDGTYCFLTSGGLVLQEAAGVYADNGVGFTLLGTTAWLRLAGIQGFQYLWDSLWQGVFPGTNQIQFQIAYDYNPAIVDTFVLNETAGPVSGSQVFGGLSPRTYTKTLTAPLVPGSVVLKTHPSFGFPTVLAQDDGNGNLVAVGGSTISAGTITYATAVVSWHDSTDRQSTNLELDFESATSFPNLIQLRLDNSLNAIEAVQFTIQMLAPFWNPASALSLNALDLEIGVDPKAYRNIGPTASVG